MLYFEIKDHSEKFFLKLFYKELQKHAYDDMPTLSLVPWYLPLIQLGERDPQASTVRSTKTTEGRLKYKQSLALSLLTSDST